MIARLLTAMTLLATLAAAHTRADTDAPRPVHTLRSGALCAEVMDPFHPQRYNRGVRFTPVAAVLHCTLAGQSFLYAPREHDPVADHGGLATEFDLCIPGGPEADFPPGYREAKVGQGFLKIGVGVLRKSAKPYTLFQEPEIIEPAKTTVEWGADTAVFRQTCAGTEGYAYALDATVRVREDLITLDWKLRNTGTKPFVTRQYTHNFFRFGERGPGDGYALAFPYDFQAEGLEVGQRQSGREILFFKEIPTWINAAVLPPAGYSGPNALELRSTQTGQSIRCETSLPGFVTAIHARKDYIAPEQFIVLSLAPGKEASWSRSYLLTAGSKP